MNRLCTQSAGRLFSATPYHFPDVPAHWQAKGVPNSTTHPESVATAEVGFQIPWWADILSRVSA